jgi:RNA polymerase sigma factor (TIGR02999 family)
MQGEVQAEVTTLLARIRAGDAAARARLGEVVYAELRRMAGGLIRDERPGHTLGVTGLAHEAYLRLFRQPSLEATPDRAYLFSAAAEAMRRVLVDHARARAAAKRGGDWQRVPLDDVLDSFERQCPDLLALHEALDQLAALNERQARAVELRFFGGCEVSEVAEALGVSQSTAEKDLAKALGFLRGRLAGRL